LLNTGITIETTGASAAGRLISPGDTFLKDDSAFCPEPIAGKCEALELSLDAERLTFFRDR
jgi:hypothetical protein